MPLFEVYNSMVKEKPRAATQEMASSPEPFSTPEDEFGELIWDNNNGPRKKAFQDNKDGIVTGVVTKLATGIGEVFPTAKNHELFPGKKRSEQFGLSVRVDGDNTADADANVVPWMSYIPTEEGLPREIPQEEDYCAEFLNEFSAAFDLKSSTLPPPADHRSSSGAAQVVRHFGGSDHGRTAKDGAVGSIGREESGAGKVVGICSRSPDFSQQHDQLNSSVGVPERFNPTANYATGRRRQQQQQQQERGRISPISTCKAPSSRDAPSRGGGGVINFSHFLRPVALAKASLEGNRVAGGKLRSCHESTSGSKPVESTLVNSASVFKCISRTPPLTVDAKPAAKPPHQEAIMVNVDKRTDANLKKKDNARDADHDMPSSSFSASAALSRHEGKRPSEAADEASSSSSSSSSSANSNGEASNNYKRRGKRKHCEQEEEEDSDHFRKPDPKEFAGRAKRDRRTGKHVICQRSVSTKRSRASEVHNLSERRRRDKINERMRALQELIPNCNKVDKASMLEEAIEYLKSLQFQLQMMSMGSGSFYMPQSAQSFRMPTLTTPFPAMGMGLGYGMGMGMYGMNGSPNPMFPVPPVHPQQFACANSFAGRAQAGLPGTAAAVSPQMLGAPRQGATPVLMPRLPLNTLLALSVKANMASDQAPRTSPADPLTTAVNSAVQKPN